MASVTLDRVSKVYGSLAIVKEIVEASGGRVGAVSEDHSTKFWFSLPAA